QGDAFSPRPVDGRGADHRTLRWTRRPGTSEGPFRLHSVCYCTVAASAAHGAEPTDVRPPTKPKPGDQVRRERGSEVDDPLIAACARDLAAGLERPADQAQVLYRFVEQDIASEPSIAGASVGAVECLKQGAGDSAAKSRLLAALCRNCGIPVR